MPWPLELHNNLADHFSGGLRFWPFPSKSYTYNQPIFRTMEIALIIERMFKKNPVKWTPQEDELYLILEKMKTGQV